MEAADPFGSITDLCRISPSQEELLRHCGFAVADEPEEQEEEEDLQVSVEPCLVSTGIVMVTPPDSLEADDENDSNGPGDDASLKTQPGSRLIASSNEHRENRAAAVEGETLDVRIEVEKTVDLGADADNIYSDEERRESENEVIYHKSKKVRVSKGEIVFKECLSESRLKNLKSSNENFGVGDELGKSSERLIKSMEKLNSVNFSPHSDPTVETSGQSSAKRYLDFSTEVLEVDTETIHRVLGHDAGEEINKKNQLNCKGPNNGNGEKNSNLGRKSIEDIDKYRYIGSTGDDSCQSKRKTQGMRTLPESIYGLPKKNTENERNNYREITILDVLKMLAENCDYDSSIEKKSILDVAKSRGMTFP